MQTPSPNEGANQTIESAANTSVEAERRQMSVIGADIVITGNIDASVDLHLEGKVIGDVRCATLILGESGAIKGRVDAERVKVSGIIEGAIDTKDLAVEATSKVSGEIAYERLRVANGGLVEGTLKQRVRQGSEDSGKLKLVGGKSEESADAAE